ncbi:hypothetical protein DL96DRAFT_1550841 [Flagelloscypha sp. PMI_526]|nr:hypothetical protein DL96DRAFT_1550841 [Flagelloscypha sp. PMI_526]
MLQVRSPPPPITIRTDTLAFVTHHRTDSSRTLIGDDAPDTPSTGSTVCDNSPPISAVGSVVSPIVFQHTEIHCGGSRKAAAPPCNDVRRLPRLPKSSGSSSDPGCSSRRPRPLPSLPEHCTEGSLSQPDSPPAGATQLRPSSDPSTYGCHEEAEDDYAPSSLARPPRSTSLPSLNERTPVGENSAAVWHTTKASNGTDGRSIIKRGAAKPSSHLAPPRACPPKAHRHIQLTAKQAAQIAQCLKSGDLFDSDSDSASESGSEEEDEEDFTISVVHGIAYRAAHIRRVSRRFSRRWYHDQGGRKWEASDYNEVLNALRKL